MVERRSATLTVLFTDIVGSTELMASMGDTAFDGLRKEHVAQLREVLASHNGVEVKGTGDGLLATFTSAVDALGAGIAAQQAAARHSRTVGVSLRIRVGLAIGEVAFEEDDIFGTPVVEAARLVALARPDQILCSALVRMMAGSRAGVAFQDVGVVELKGLPEPVAVCEVAWERLREVTAPLPLPSLLAASGRIFVGREEVVDRLRQRWKDAVAHGPRLLLVGGEPGVGKTRLAAEVGRALHAEGALVLAGRCDEDLGVPYQPFVEALHHYVAHAAERHLGRHGGELTRLFPELLGLEPGLSAPLRSDPEIERYRLFEAVTAWLAAASEQAPVLLVIDDLQWAPKPTVLLLRHVLHCAEPMPLAIVATYRDTDIGRTSPVAELLADVPRLEGAERLRLDGLDVSSVSAFLAKVAGHDFDGEELAEAVWQETGGNAFFVSEVLRHLQESGTLTRQAGGWVLTTPVEHVGIPEGIRDVVGRRLSRLAESTNRVLTCACVVGLEFEPAVVQVAGGFSEDTLLAALDEAISTRMVVEVPGRSPRYRFAHALVRATLYGELTAARRVSLHRRVGEAIEAVHSSRLQDQLAALAHHWAQAAAPSAETARAVDYAKQAGDLALAQLAPHEALTYYRKAIDLLDAARATPDDDRRLELLIALGEAERRTGDQNYRETLLDAARLAAEHKGDAALLIRAVLANRRGMYASAAGRVDPERVALLRTALSASGSDDSPERARLLGALGHELAWAGSREERVRLSDEALAMARRLADHRTLARVLLERNFALSGPDLLPERQATAAELLTVATALDDPAVVAQALLLCFRGHAESGDIEAADRYLREAESRADELGEPTLRWMVRFSRTGRVLLSGDLAEAERLARSQLEVGLATGQPDAAALYAALLVGIRFEQGRLEEIEGQIAEAAAANPGLPVFQAWLALVRAETGHMAGAAEPFERLAATDFGSLPLDSAWVLSVSACAVVSARLWDRARAAVLSDLLEPYADQFVFTAAGSWGSVAYYLGLLATTLDRFDEADARFGAAAAVHERIGAPAWLARTRLEWAAMLLRRAGRAGGEQARALLTQAIDTAVTLGLRNVERRAQRLLEDAP